MSSRASSSFSAEWPEAGRAFESARPGDVIAGFRIERLIGRGETGAVYEATELGLGRAVALRLIDPARYADPEAEARLDRELGLASSLHHPGLVPLYRAGEWEGGRFLAMRLIRGESLSSTGALAEDALQPIADGLDAAHDVGITHGAVRANNVLLDPDGRAYLADLGLGRGAGAEADREGLAGLRRAPGVRAGSSRRRAPIAAGAALAVALAVAALLATRSGEESGYPEEPAPPAPAGTVALGSGLEPGPAEPVGCGPRFGGASACILVPADADGAALRATGSGVIRGWAVRGARGELTLQVLRAREAVTRIAGFSQPIGVPDSGPHGFSAEIPVDRGDLIALRLGPGATAGGRQDGGATLRWAGTGFPLPPLSEASPLRSELLVRVDVEPGARPPMPAQLSGARARAAPRGAILAETTVAVSARGAVRVRLVRVDDRIELDAFSGRRRTSRLAIADADPNGELVLFQQSCGHPRSVCLRWGNPEEETPLVHEFRVTPAGRFRLIG